MAWCLVWMPVKSDPSSRLLCAKEPFTESQYINPAFPYYKSFDSHIKCDKATALKEASHKQVTCIPHFSVNGREMLIYTTPLEGYTGLCNVRTSLKCFPSFSPFDLSTAEISSVNAAWWLWLWRIIDWRGLSPSKSPADGAKSDKVKQSVTSVMANPVMMTVAECKIYIYFILT